MENQKYLLRKQSAEKYHSTLVTSVLVWERQQIQFWSGRQKR